MHQLVEGVAYFKCFVLQDLMHQLVEVVDLMFIFMFDRTWCINLWGVWLILIFCLTGLDASTCGGCGLF